ncbi:hypothetical protein HOP50_15g74120 [Chloropicon primus]|uniref:EF-hand domain-containing protein n=1 Tax=Chloropicon primus TaxID=1764295 RepID=A0A5B8MWE5_9CHLO|nr:hypothetical protein A3770_15p73870 [Chloropicon primus]UPR04079.1 hypothetical protein HOP50_15g74120 [Chloropicon primus]|mmetsp:Transcript_12078/g.33458  ORF Transcript_12078/g.33458 Transcript_12078/m.33458 type:complete len:172 (+) Transcript_12078:70-585(+)|eukprot:QDZ24869.1 hypothetical protein A3770_15p73870 [Chloropicon primus]
MSRPTRDQLLSFFQQIDANNNGWMDAGELQKALGMSSLNFSLSVTAQMIRVYGKAREGSITPEEFVNLFNAVQNDIDAFKVMDTQGRGKLRLDQVRQAISQKGYQLDDTAFYTCCKSFDPDRTGDMGIPEYIALSLFLLSARNTFAAFDFQRTGVITLNFGQFIYATANCR